VVRLDVPDGQALNPEAGLSRALHPVRRDEHQSLDALQSRGAHPYLVWEDRPDRWVQCASDALDDVRQAAAEDVNLVRIRHPSLVGEDVRKLRGQE
jgi:hypothetical protein